MRILLYVALVGAVLANDNDWQPIVPESSFNYATVVKSPQRALEPKLKILNRRPPSHSRPYILGSSENHLSSIPHVAAPQDDSCSIFKIGMNQELFYQYLEYDKDIPDLNEFTLCMWTKYHNHTGDHPLFSYAVSDNPKEISVWISNTAQASYFSMAVHGQTFFRLNYPLKLNKWYHSCQSWNGKTGEWQIWVNAERVGRGFHNRLVGHVIKGGGIAISGQDQSLLYKDELEPIARQPGLMGEITMVQLYHVALTAGKAHKDHKHHHAHHFTHDGQPIQGAIDNVTEPPPPIPTPLGNGNYLIGNQIQTLPNLNIAGAQQEQMIPVQLPNGLQLQQQFANGQLGSRVVSEQLLGSAQQNGLQQTHGLSLEQQFLNGHLQIGGGPSGIRHPQNAAKTTVFLSGSLINPANVQFIDDSSPHSLFRRESTKREKRDNPEKELKEETTSGKKEKRDLISLPDGSIVDEALLSPHLNTNSDQEDLTFQQSLMDGLAGFVGNLPVQNEQKDTVDEREPAEAEVKAVMEVCSGCAPEPFKKALVLSWRTVAKKLYSGTHYYKGVPICRAF